MRRLILYGFLLADLVMVAVGVLAHDVFWLVLGFGLAWLTLRHTARSEGEDDTPRPSKP